MMHQSFLYVFVASFFGVIYCSSVPVFEQQQKVEGTDPILVQFTDLNVKPPVRSNNDAGRTFNSRGVNMSFIIPAFTLFPMLRNFLPSFISPLSLTGQTFGRAIPESVETDKTTDKVTVADTYITRPGVFCSVSHQGTWRDLDTCSGYYTCTAQQNTPAYCGVGLNGKRTRDIDLSTTVVKESDNNVSYSNDCVSLVFQECKEGWIYDVTKSRCMQPTEEMDVNKCHK